MELLINDLSLHGQFTAPDSFRVAIGRVMKIRQVARQSKRELYCHRGLVQAQVAPGMTMPQAVQKLKIEERRALMQWLTRQGPFWEDERRHTADDWFECKGEIVTDTAVGEAAWRNLNGIDHALVSLTPSDWEFSPIPVAWVQDDADNTRTGIEVGNHWTPESVETLLRDTQAPPDSWRQLEGQAKARCPRLIFAADAFTPLGDQPFVSGAAGRLSFVLDTLNRFKSCFGPNDQLTAEGHKLYQDFFTGKKGKGGRGALFSDSSDSEKGKFKQKMTFDHPDKQGKSIFCPWHGKVQTPQLRVHFSWPVRAREPLYVVYVGPKITKR